MEKHIRDVVIGIVLGVVGSWLVHRDAPGRFAIHALSVYALPAHELLLDTTTGQSWSFSLDKERQPYWRALPLAPDARPLASRAPTEEGRPAQAPLPASASPGARWEKSPIVEEGRAMVLLRGPAGQTELVPDTEIDARRAAGWKLQERADGSLLIAMPLPEAPGFVEARLTAEERSLLKAARLPDGYRIIRGSPRLPDGYRIIRGSPP